MADDELCSPIIELYDGDNSTLPTTSQPLFAFGNEAAEAATVASVTWSSGAEYPRVSSTGYPRITNGYPRVSTEKLIEEALYRVVIVVVCVFGLVCNIINLLVLSRKSLTATMERLERSAHYGLVGKAGFTQSTCTRKQENLER